MCILKMSRFNRTNWMSMDIFLTQAFGMLQNYPVWDLWISALFVPPSTIYATKAQHVLKWKTRHLKETLQW